MILLEIKILADTSLQIWTDKVIFQKVWIYAGIFLQDK